MRLVPGVIVSRRANAQENFERVTESVAIISIEFFRPNVDSELSAEPDVDLVPVRKIAHVADRKRVDREDFSQIARREHELMPGFLDALPACINRVALALVI